MPHEFALFDVVRLTVDRPGDGLRAGAIGAVVGVFDSPERAYEVEFVDADGATIAVVAVPPDQLETR